MVEEEDSKGVGTREEEEGYRQFQSLKSDNHSLAKQTTVFPSFSLRHLIQKAVGRKGAKNLFPLLAVGQDGTGQHLHLRLIP